MHNASGQRLTRLVITRRGPLPAYASAAAIPWTARARVRQPSIVARPCQPRRDR